MHRSQQAAQHLTSRRVLLHVGRTTSLNSPSSRCFAAESSNSSPKPEGNPSNSSAKPAPAQPTKQKTQAELDRELQLKMQGLAGGGGEFGVEYEDGQPVSMKRSVRNNMFRYI